MIYTLVAPRRMISRARKESESNFTARARAYTRIRKDIDCGRHITDSLIRRNVTILNHEQNPSKATNS